MWLVVGLQFPAVTFTPDFRFQLNIGWSAFRFLPPDGHLSFKRLALAGAVAATLRRVVPRGTMGNLVALRPQDVVTVVVEGGVLHVASQTRQPKPCYVEGVAITGGKWCVALLRAPPSHTQTHRHTQTHTDTHRHTHTDTHTHPHMYAHRHNDTHTHNLSLTHHTLI